MEVLGNRGLILGRKMIVLGFYVLIEDNIYIYFNLIQNYIMRKVC